MSTISDAYDEIRADLKILFPNKFQLTNAVNIEDNTAAALRDGFGIRIAGATNTERQLACKLSQERDIVIILTERTFTKELDIDKKFDAMKSIVEQQLVVIKKYEKEPTLVNGDVPIFRYSSDQGVENVSGEEETFFKIESIFKMEIFENLT